MQINFLPPPLDLLLRTSTVSWTTELPFNWDAHEPSGNSRKLGKKKKKSARVTTQPRSEGFQQLPPPVPPPTTSTQQRIPYKTATLDLAFNGDHNKDLKEEQHGPQTEVRSVCGPLRQRGPWKTLDDTRPSAPLLKRDSAGSQRRSGSTCCSRRRSVSNAGSLSIFLNELNATTVLRLRRHSQTPPPQLPLLFQAFQECKGDRAPRCRRNIQLSEHGGD